jgi:hypothetical protein
LGGREAKERAVRERCGDPRATALSNRKWQGSAVMSSSQNNNYFIYIISFHFVAKESETLGARRICLPAAAWKLLRFSSPEILFTTCGLF